MLRRLPAVAAGLVLLLPMAGCGDDPDPAADLPLVDPCLDLPEDAPVPERCVGDPEPSASPPAEGSAAYPALVVEPRPGQLAAGGNDLDPALTTRTFQVVLPAGSRLGVQAVCEGQSRLTVTVEPGSEAATDVPCDGPGPRESTVEESAAAAAPVSYLVTATADAPARWYVSVYGVPS